LSRTESFEVKQYLVKVKLQFGNSFDTGKLRAVCLAHLRGLAWCAHYYYHGEELIEFHSNPAIRLLVINESID